MAEKRKAVSNVQPNKKAKVAPKTIAKEPTATAAKQWKSKDERSSERRAIKSVLSQEEKSFPRGGASVLTPLEQKQIRAQAERDVLFEQSTGKKAPGFDGEEDTLFEDPEARTAQVKVANRRKSDKAGLRGGKESGETALRIQGLSFKNLSTGSLVLGRVAAVTSKDVALTLPNNLTGYVPITAVSAGLDARIAALLNEEEHEDDSDEDVDDDIELGKLFRPGQWLRAIVVESASRAADGAGEQKRHIELSLNPALVNNSLTFDSIATNAFIQASIRSVEDHGIIMDLGLQDDSIRGFISKKELGLGLNFEDLTAGQVMLCLVTGKGSNGKVLKLTPDTARFSAYGPVKQTPILAQLPDVDVLLPGVAVDALVTASTAGGVSGKVMGLVDVSADIVHADIAGLSLQEVSKKYVAASKVRARVIWSLPKDDGTRQVGISLLNRMLAMAPPAEELGSNISEKARSSATEFEEVLSPSSIVEDAKITSVVAERGVYLSLHDAAHSKPLQAYAHISQLSDTRTDDVQAESGRYKIGSTHQVRVLGFNSLDGLYYVSLKPSVLSQPFLRLEDIKLGSNVSGKVDRLLLGAGNQGVTGVLVRLAKSVTALVPSIHMSDAPLQHPEKKFREGFEVKGRVLSVDLDKRQVRITLKKTLLSSNDDEIWDNYSKLAIGQEAKGTIIKLLDRGAVVQYYGDVRAFLPISEMSDAFVQSPAKHFRLGQTVTTRILSIEPEAREMRVTCRAAERFDEKTQQYWDKLVPGQLVSVHVSAILADKVEVELEGGISGVIRVGHLLDGSASKAESRLKKLRVGQKLNDTLILSKSDRSQQITLSYKSSMVSDAQQKQLIVNFDDIKTGKAVHGFVQNVTPEGVYVEFANRMVGFLPKKLLTSEMLQAASFGLRKDQSINVWVAHIDEARSRFALSIQEPVKDDAKPHASTANEKLVSPADASLAVMQDLSLNKVIKARVSSIKNSQVNVHVADGIHGRIDISEVFDSWSEIKNSKVPLQQRYKVNQIIDVKILGTRDAKGWRFLPFSHRGRGNTVIELSAKRSRIESGSADLISGMGDVQHDKTYIGFVNNIADDCMWVSLSPAIRGRIAFMDLSNDVGLLQNVQKHHPIGSALQVKVKSVSPESEKLDLTVVSHNVQTEVTIETINKAEIVPGRVTKIAEHGVTVQLSNDLAVVVPMVELSDDFDQADPTKYSKHDIVRARVLDVNRPNKRISLSLRPSLVLSSGMPVKDVHVTSHSMLKEGILMRGFVKHIGEKSVLVSLSGTVDAYVPVSDLSDQYIKDWRSLLQPQQLVKGRIIAVDEGKKHVHLSLKKSQVSENYQPPMTFNQIQAGMIVTGTARKVEDFGIFIDIDNTHPRVSGLAHRSEIAEKRIADVRGLYSQGDRVKAKVLKVDTDSRKINLGLKASYFTDVDDADAMSIDDDSDGEGVAVDAASDEDLINQDDLELEDVEDEDDISSEEEDNLPVINGTAVKGLSTSGFDWTGNALADPSEVNYESEPDLAPKSKKRNKSEIKVDLTGDLDTHGPQTTSDYERQLLGQPNNSGLWIQYMAFHLQLSEIQKARDIAERALRTIHIRETDEKANVWIALLNLEVEYGDEDSTEVIFKKACQVSDPLEIHEKLASIYIDSGKQDKADGIFEKIIGNKSFRASPDVWLNYATFFMSQLQQPDRARALLARALQSIPHHEHRLLTAKFAALEFRTTSGNAERGRTIFEALVTEWPRWTAGWDMWVDIEKSRLEKQSSSEDTQDIKDKVRQLFERMSQAGMKKRRAKFVFKRWLEFEEQQGDVKGQEKVKTLAKEYVEMLQARGRDDEAEE